MGTKKQPKSEVTATPEAAAFMNNLKAMVPKVTDDPVIDLPVYKGTSNSYYEIASGKGVRLVMNVQLKFWGDTTLIWRFATIRALTKPPEHMNYRGMAKFIDSDGQEKIGMYLDQHKMKIADFPIPEYTLQAADDSQGIATALVAWVTKQAQLEGLTMTAKPETLAAMIRKLWMTPEKVQVFVFAPPKDIWHEKRTYDKGSPAQSGGDDE